MVSAGVNDAYHSRELLRSRLVANEYMMRRSLIEDPQRQIARRCKNFKRQVVGKEGNSNEKKKVDAETA